MKKAMANRPMPVKKKEKLVGDDFQQVHPHQAYSHEQGASGLAAGATSPATASTIRELKKRKRLGHAFSVTDNTNSVTVSKFIMSSQQILRAWSVTSNLELSPFAIAEAEAPPARKIRQRRSSCQTSQDEHLLG